MHILGLLDFILNLAGLVLWLNWRSIRFDPFHRPVPSTLSGTVRRAEPSRLKRWHFLAALGLLLLLRAVFYWLIAPGLNWVPTLDLIFVAFAFRGDVFGAILLFSLLSLMRALWVLYFWMIFLVMLHRGNRETDPMQSLLQFHTGRIARWPWFLQLALPVVAVAVLWLALHPLLVQAGVVGRAQSNVVLLEQGLLAGLALCLSLKFLLPAILFVHLISSYVYFGGNPLWQFIGATARRILAPLRLLPLRIGKMDFSPLVGIVLILLALHFLPEKLRVELNRRNLTLWPQ